MVERGFVTYSNEAKTDLLGVSSRTIAEHGAVSEPVARAMAQGALGRSEAAGRGVDHRHCRARRRQPREAGRARPFRARAAGGATEHLERRYGDLGRSAVRRRRWLMRLRSLEKAGREA